MGELPLAKLLRLCYINQIIFKKQTIIKLDTDFGFKHCNKYQLIYLGEKVFEENFINSLLPDKS